jgi:DNA polymerase-3 subunit gamma/tau
VARDGGRLLGEVATLHDRGLEMKRLAEEIVRHLRNVVVAKLVPGSPLDLPEAELAEVRAQAAAADAAQLTRLFDLCQRAVAEVKLSEQPRYVLEVALLSGVFLAPGAGIAELLARAEALSRGAPLPPGTSSAPAGGRSPPPPAPPPKAIRTAQAAEAPRQAPAGTAPVPAAKDPLPTGKDDRWRAAVEAVEKESSMAASALKQAAVLGLTDGEVALQLSPGMYAATLEKRRTEVEAVFGRFFGRPTRLSLTIGAPKPAQEGGEVPAAATSSLAAAEAAERTARVSRVREAARAHPNIQAAVRILEGNIDKIEEI